jgi:hypothetical protein
MRTRHIGTLAALAFAVVLTTAGLMAFAQSTTSDKGSKIKSFKPFKPIEPLPEMMAGQRKLYTEIKDGILDKTWEEAATSAWILAEIANANQYQRNDQDYRKFAGRLSKEAVTLAKQLKKPDERGAKETVARIGRTCKACHEQFKKD